MAGSDNSIYEAIKIEREASFIRIIAVVQVVGIFLALIVVMVVHHLLGH
jgi:hypothetical protein